MFCYRASALTPPGEDRRATQQLGITPAKAAALERAGQLRCLSTPFWPSARPAGAVLGEATGKAHGLTGSGCRPKAKAPPYGKLCAALSLPRSAYAV